MVLKGRQWASPAKAALPNSFKEENFLRISDAQIDTVSIKA